MSENGNGNGRMVMRASPWIVLSGAAAVVAVLGTLSGWAGSYLNSDRTATQTIEQLKAKNDTQDLRIESATKQLESRLDNLKAVYDQRFDTILYRMQEAQQGIQAERLEQRQVLDAIRSDVGSLKTDVARIVERQGMQPARR